MMNRYIIVIAFTASVLGLFFIFDVLPGIGSFAGSVLLVIGGTVLVCQSMFWEAEALARKGSRFRQVRAKRPRRTEVGQFD